MKFNFHHAFRTELQSSSHLIILFKAEGVKWVRACHYSVQWRADLKGVANTWFH
jgi:hypothetical protein